MGLPSCNIVKQNLHCSLAVFDVLAFLAACVDAHTLKLIVVDNGVVVVD